MFKIYTNIELYFFDQFFLNCNLPHLPCMKECVYDITFSQIRLNYTCSYILYLLVYKLY